MSKRTLGVAVVFLVGCGVGGVSSQLVVPKASAQQEATLTKWQYFCDTANDGSDSAALANKLGKQGWELVGANAHNVWCFKRPKL